MDNKKATISLYRITNKINGKKYIGITKSDIETRWTRHNWKYYLENRHGALQGAIKKYGKDNFFIEHVCEVFKEEDAVIMERFFISEENTMWPNGYNMTSGGEKFSGIIVSDKTREKRKLARLGKPGHKHYEETKIKIGLAAKGRKISEETRLNMKLGQVGRSPASEETREKIRVALTGKKLSEQHIKNMKNSLKGRKSWNKGKPMPEETKEKIRMAKLNYYMKKRIDGKVA